VPGALFALCVAAVYLPFLARLPARTRNLFFLAGFVYVSGAIGFEMVGGRQAALYGDDNLTYKLLAHVEESLEMAGLVVLLYALLDYAARHVGPVSVRVTAGAADAVVPPPEPIQLHGAQLLPAQAGDELRRSAPVTHAAPARAASQPVSPL
jgi:hypothetical protein